MSSPRVTFIIPAYDAEATLAEAVESLQAQTCATWNAIIVDDGSRDRTAQVADDFAAVDQRVRVVRQANGGESAARNAGVAAATTDWLAFLDADDWLLPTYLQRMVDVILRDSSADVIHCDWVRVGGNGELGASLVPPHQLDFFPVLARQNCFAVHACVFRRALAARIGPFDVTLQTCPDWDFWQRIARVSPRFVHIHEVLACYRLRPLSAATNAKQVLIDGLRVIARGHAPDARVQDPDPRYVAGMPPAHHAEARLVLLCWAAGLAIGRGLAFDELFELVPPEPVAITANAVAESLFATVPMSAGRLGDLWPECWERVEPQLDACLHRLEAHSGTPGLSADAKSILMRKVLTKGVPLLLRASSPTDPLEPSDRYRTLARNWERIAAERGAEVAELRGWIAELEEAKLWHDGQRQAWQRRAEAAERALTGKEGQARAAGTGDAPAAGQRNPELFAGFRNVEPVSREWGYDRGLPVDRYYIERFLDEHRHDVAGRVLEIGDNTYTRRFGADRVTVSDVLHVVPGNARATFVGDLAQAGHLPSDTFDCVILTQTLQLIYDVAAALRTVHRILKPGGVLLATVPGITRTSHTEWTGSWYWRLTPASARRLFEAEFGAEHVQLTTHGNVLAACAFLYGAAAEELTSAELDHVDVDYDVTIAARAVKSFVRSSDRAGTGGTSRAILHRSADVNTVILLYHRISDSPLDPWELSVSRDNFDDQLRVLRREATVVGLRDVFGNLRAHTDERPRVAITFDDGYADNLSAALPLLEKHGVPATVFVCTGPVSKRGEFWWDTLQRLLLWPSTLPAILDLVVGTEPLRWDLGTAARYSEVQSRAHISWRAWEPPPTPRHALYVELWHRLHRLDHDDRTNVLADLRVWAGGEENSPREHRALGPDELVVLSASRWIEIGAHSCTHPALASLPAARQRSEIAGSRDWLHGQLGSAPTSFSYPFGRAVDYSLETIRIVRETGFERACSNIAGLVTAGTDACQLPRMQAKNWTGAELAWQLRSIAARRAPLQ